MESSRKLPGSGICGALANNESVVRELGDEIRNRSLWR